MSQVQSAAGSSDEAHHARATRQAPAEWQRAHDELLRLARSRAGLDFEEGCWLLRACQSGVHARLGYGSFGEYVGRLFGYGARLVQEKLRVAQALERLPELTQAVKRGVRGPRRIGNTAQGVWVSRARLPSKRRTRMGIRWVDYVEPKRPCFELENWLPYFSNHAF